MGQGEVGPEEFSQTVCAAYSEAVQWRRNIFSVPSGRSGKAFMSELARLFRAYADGSALESIALTAVMLMPLLLLQRPHQNSKNMCNALNAAWAAGKQVTLAPF